MPIRINFKPFLIMLTILSSLFWSTFIFAEENQPLILAHYMPWYTAKPLSEKWGWHWTMNHFDPDQQIDGRREIASNYYPLIGPYDSGDPDALEYHLLLMKITGIDGVIVDWYGLTDHNDYAILHRNTTRLLQQCERLHMKFVICYEDQTIPALVNGNRISETERVTHAISEINWLSKYWFKSGSYVKINGDPILLSFGHAGLNNEEWSQVLSNLASPISYFSQDFQRPGAMGGFSWPAPSIGMSQVDRFLTVSKDWPEKIPVAFPRFHDVYQKAGVSAGYPRLPDNGGRTFKETFKKAINSNAGIIQIATWNDWGEGTQIEPSVEFGFRELEHIRSVIQESNFHQSTTRTEDLRLPLKLLQLRRAHLEYKQKCDIVSQLISRAQYEEADMIMEEFKKTGITP